MMQSYATYKKLTSMHYSLTKSKRIENDTVQILKATVALLSEKIVSSTNKFTREILIKDRSTRKT
jgi:hypothetical protein